MQTQGIMTRGMSHLTPRSRTAECSCINPMQGLDTNFNA